MMSPGIICARIPNRDDITWRRHGGIYADPVAEFELWFSASVEKAWIYPHCRTDPGTGYRRQYRDIQRRQCRVAESSGRDDSVGILISSASSLR